MDTFSSSSPSTAAIVQGTKRNNPVPSVDGKIIAWVPLISPQLIRASIRNVVNATGNSGYTQVPPTRLVDYVAIIGARDALVTLTSGVKEEDPFNVAYRGVVLDRYPLHNVPNVPFPPSVGMFALPAGLHLHRERLPATFFFTFAMTAPDGTTLHGTSFVFMDSLPAGTYKRYTPETWADVSGEGLDASQSNDAPTDAKGPLNVSLPESTYAHKALVILSHWPLFSAFRCFSLAMYKLFRRGSTQYPLEHYIRYFATDVPLPPAGRIRVHWSVESQVFTIARPPPNDFPFADFPLQPLFQALSTNNVLSVFEGVLLEKKILLLSKYFGVASTVAATLRTLMFPFAWPHIYLPLVPPELLNMIDSPVPFILGTNSGFFARDANFPVDVIVVDLDSNHIRCTTKMPPLPERERTKLYLRLRRIANLYVKHHPALSSVDDPEHPLRDKGGLSAEEGGISVHAATFDVRAARSAFLGFFLSLFLRYRQFLIFPSGPDESPVEFPFRKEDFVEEHPESSKSFLEPFMETQAFLRFVRDRVYGCTNDYELRFFDELIDARVNQSSPSLLKRDTPFLDDKSYAHEETIVASAPDTKGLPPGPFAYTTFPKLNPKLYGASQQTESPLRATWVEPKRQMSLSNVLQYAVVQKPRKPTPQVYEQLQTWYSTWMNEVGMRGGPRHPSKDPMECAVLISQSNVRRNIERRKFRRQRRAAATLQAVVRGHLSRKDTSHTISLIIRLQAWIRGWRARRMFNAYKMGANAVVRRMVAKLFRKRFLRQMRGIVRLQALLRGHRARKRVGRILEGPLQPVQDEVFSAWEGLGMLLMYRSQFLVAHEQPTPMSSVAWKFELERTRAMKNGTEDALTPAAKKRLDPGWKRIHSPKAVEKERKNLVDKLKRTTKEGERDLLVEIMLPETPRGTKIKERKKEICSRIWVENNLKAAISSTKLLLALEDLPTSRIAMDALLSGRNESLNVFARHTVCLTKI